MFHSEKLSLNEILDTIEQIAITPQGKARIRSLEPSTDCNWIENSQQQIAEAKGILDTSGTFPLNPLTGFNKAFDDLTKHAVLSASQIYALGSFLEDVERIQRFMVTKAQIAPTISVYATSMDSLPQLLEKISTSVHGDSVLDDASPTLSKIRKHIRMTEDKIKDKLKSILQIADSNALLTDAHISMRDGRYVIPVKTASRNQISGQVLDSSKSGNTSFIEPEAVKRLSESLQGLKADEDNECYRILSALTVAIAEREHILAINREAFITYDILSAKAKYATRINASPVQITPSGPLHLIDARHPQLGSNAIPLTLALNNKNIVITGPNTGGKTVVLKTVGLLTLMAMCGLLVPANRLSTFRIFKSVLCDIGDGQSITQNLSTFSSHIVNIQNILAFASAESLILLDEVGSGTEPNEGAGIAIAILETLQRKGASILATTHFSQLKNFAQETTGFVNGSMLFDTETLSPLYRLAIGEAGKSHALLIALKLGLQSDVLDRAHQLTYGQPFDRQTYLELLNQQLNHLSKQVMTTQTPIDAGDSYNGEHIKTEPATSPATRIFSAKTPFSVGDSVYLPALKCAGVVVSSANRKGDHAVDVKGKRIIVNHKRMKPFIDKKELYPQQYDLDIVTKSWAQRKAEKALSKGKKGGFEHPKSPI